MHAGPNGDSDGMPLYNNINPKWAIVVVGGVCWWYVYKKIFFIYSKFSMNVQSINQRVCSTILYGLHAPSAVYETSGSTNLYFLAVALLFKSILSHFRVFIYRMTIVFSSLFACCLPFATFQLSYIFDLFTENA